MVLINEHIIVIEKQEEKKNICATNWISWIKNETLIIETGDLVTMD